MSIVEQAYNQALEVLRHSARRGAFYASGLPGGYEATWARDSMITTLGAVLVGDKFKQPIKKSLALLAKHQSALGQIPNAVGTYNTDRRSEITFNSIDSSLWFIIGLSAYSRQSHDRLTAFRYKKQQATALRWLSYQDPDEVQLLAQQPTMDWMDAFPHKYGYCINTQALYYAVLNLTGQAKQARHLQQVVNGRTAKYLSLYDRDLGYYYPWAWKNHDGDREHEQWFDSLGNILAVLSGLADRSLARGILAYIAKAKINRPYACKAIWPPITKSDPEWHSYFDKCDARQPLHYLNGGIWPFIGGFYVAALVKTKQYRQATAELRLLAQANLQELKGHGFNEWLHGDSGKPLGEPYQAWSAATYIYAYHCCQQQRALHFDY